MRTAGGIAALVLTMGLGFGAPALAQEAPAPTRSLDLHALFSAVGAMYGEDPALLAAIATVESGSHYDALSPKGAMGLMQLMPATAREFAVADPWNPVENVLGAARFLAWLRAQGPASSSLPVLLAAYNAGSAAVERYGGVPPYPETTAYVRQVLWLYLLGTTPPQGAMPPHHAPQAQKGDKSLRHADAAPRGSDAQWLAQLAALRRARAAAR